MRDRGSVLATSEGSDVTIYGLVRSGIPGVFLWLEDDYDPEFTHFNLFLNPEELAKLGTTFLELAALARE